jgi:alpha-ketoglutaric semialdehyde dehydrogenase
MSGLHEHPAANGDGRIRSALLVVDMQEDYLREGLVPTRANLVQGVASVMTAARAAGAVIAHIRTAVLPDGSDAMPHRRGQPLCVTGTAGAQPPEELRELSGELVVTKQFFRGFAHPELDAHLRSAGVTHIVVAGVHTHACVRETVLDAYERGYQVAVARDAVGSNAPDHAEHTLSWLDGRAATVTTAHALIDDGWLPEAPPIANGVADSVAAAVDRARWAHERWRESPISARRDLLRRWAEQLRREREFAAKLIVTEVHKPARLARDEVERAIGHIDATIELPTHLIRGDAEIAPDVRARQVPLGVVAAIMPWNNPLALAMGKIAPALLTGNTVVLKPSPVAERCADLIAATLARAGAPEGVLTIVRGGADVGARLAASAGVDAVCVTGSVATGRAIAELCRRSGKPLQAELGGNNAAIVLADADLDRVVPALLASAFSFAGQRCTAIRRFVVLDSVLQPFMERAVTALAQCDPRDPDDESSVVGPMVSAAAAHRVAEVIARARREGVEVLAGGELVTMGADTAITPGLLLARNPHSSVVQQETFGPLAVIQPVADFAAAVNAANDVEQGLIMAICTSDDTAATELARRAAAGILYRGAGPVPVHPDAPFGGWKASGMGPPEHGVWDLQFFTRPQALYGRWSTP